MPRNTSQAIRLGSASAQAMVRSGHSHLERPPKQGYHPEPSVTRMPRSRIPRPQIERIKQRHILGQSQREIARAERRSRPTIARIINGEEMQAFVQEMRERFYALVPDALATIEYALQEQSDARIAYDILRDVGVAPRKGEPLQLPATTPEDGYSRQAVMIANVLLEANQNMGVDLPPGVEEALPKGSQESTEGAKLSRPKLLRR